MPPVFVWWCLTWMTPHGIVCESAHLTQWECQAAFSRAKDINAHDYPVNCVPNRTKESPQLLRRLGFGYRREVI